MYYLKENENDIDLTSDYYRSQYNIVKYCSFSASLISFLAVLFVLSMYALRSNLRTIAFRMIVYLQISDGIVAFSMMLQIFDAIDNPSLCKTQAFLGNFGCVSSFFWTCCISTSIYFSSTGRWKVVDPYEKWFLLISYGIPLILSIMYINHIFIS